jgi:hypothetical protein
MRIYEGSPRQDWEEVLRSVGAYLDDRGMRELVFLESDTGFIIQGTAVSGATGSSRAESVGQAVRETMTLQDEEVGEFMDKALAQRGQQPDPTPKHYESQLRIVGRFLDEHHPRDLFFFEIDGAYVIRMSTTAQAGLKHELVEFTRDDVADLIARAPALRRSVKAKDSPA